MGYILFVFRKKMWFGFLVDGIIFIPLLYVCHRLVLLPFDLLMKQKTITARFVSKVGTHELQYSRGTYCYEWEFKDENGHSIRLMIPEATTQTSIIQPKKDRLLRISYYRLSKLLMSWEIIEE